MSSLPYSLYRAEQVRQLDHYVIHTLGTSGTILMERAGAAAFAELQHRWLKAKKILVVCGQGNNGGDGYVLARLAKEAGLEVTVMQVGDANQLQGDALAAMQRLQNAEVNPTSFNGEALISVDLIVDGLLGTGLRGEIRDEFSKAITAINQANKPVLALDIPSGLDADSGIPHGIAVRATCTVSFLGLKRGLFTGDGPAYAGHVVFHNLNAPAEVYAQQAVEAERIDYARYKAVLTPRSRVAHKGEHGHVLVVGGEQGFTGAARMAGEAALRVGAGLVSIATRESHAAIMNASRPELMVHGVETAESFQRLAERADVIAIGPGLGREDWGKHLLQLAMESDLPLIVDADALNILSQQSQSPREQWVLTPHSAEAARLLGCGAAQIHQDRFAAVSKIQKLFGGVVVLKGAGTLITDGSACTFVCSDGNPGMASGGMGDILTGAIAGLVAQGLGLTLATHLGVTIHAAAGDAAAKAAGERGMLASDLMSWLRRLVNPA